MFDTQAILDRPPEVAITDRAGLAGITYWYNTHLPKLRDSQEKLDKNDPSIIKIKEETDKLYKDGRSNCLSHEKLLNFAKSIYQSMFKNHYKYAKIP
ncbi:MAG: hypothetical protein Nk1A_5090 [Endomicrobiia bacterium]|nr:MAG: hypothetical protein Nk1A_5090 [Endomicrobiia bacterium]